MCSQVETETKTASQKTKCQVRPEIKKKMALLVSHFVYSKNACNVAWCLGVNFRVHRGGGGKRTKKTCFIHCWREIAFNVKTKKNNKGKVITPRLTSTLGPTTKLEPIFSGCKKNRRFLIVLLFILLCHFCSGSNFKFN